MCLDAEKKNTITEIDNKAQYHKQVQHLLGQKYVLAHILIHTIGEFKGMAPKDVVERIVGEPRIGDVPMGPELESVKTEEGLQSENSEKVVESVSYDVSFSVRMKDGISPMMVNLEDLKTKKEFALYDRANFYAFHLLASQKVVDYNDLEPVYSIGVYMGMEENSLCHIHSEVSDMLEPSSPSAQNYLLNILKIGVADEVPENDDEYKLHRLLWTLFSDRLSGDEKLRIIEIEYSIPITDDIKEEIQTMSNLEESLR